MTGRNVIPGVGELRELIRDVPDFPKPGILFKDITPLLANPAGLSLAVEFLTQPFRDQHIDIVVGAESRGFIFATAVARNLSAGFVPIRKPGKLPAERLSHTYDLEYGTDTLEVHTDAIKPGRACCCWMTCWPRAGPCWPAANWWNGWAARSWALPC